MPKKIILISPKYRILTWFSQYFVLILSTTDIPHNACSFNTTISILNNGRWSGQAAMPPILYYLQVDVLSVSQTPLAHFFILKTKKLLKSKLKWKNLVKLSLQN